MITESLLSSSWSCSGVMELSSSSYIFFMFQDLLYNKLWRVYQPITAEYHKIDTATRKD